MKKFTLSLLILITALFFCNQYLNADSGAPFYVYSSSTNRFNYLTDQQGHNNYLELLVKFYDDPVVDSYVITYEQIDYDGNVTKFLYSRDIFPAIAGSTGNYQFYLFYDFNNIDFVDNIAFYKISYGTTILWSGAVMKRPIYEDLNGNSVEVGEYVYTDTVLPDITDQEQFTYNYNDRFIVIHYRFDATIENQGDNLFIKFHNLSDLTLINSINTDHLFLAQAYNYDLNYEGVRNGFIIVSIDGIDPPFLETNSISLNDSYDQFRDFSFPTGAFSISITNSLDTFINSSKAVLIITEEEVKAFDFYTSTGKFSINELIRLNYIKYDSNVSNAFSTFSSYDSGLLPDEFDNNVIDSFTSSRTVSYLPSNTLLQDDVVSVYWLLIVSNTPYAGMNTDYYKIELNNSYTIVGQEDLDNRINGVLNRIGWDDEAGFMAVVIITFIILNLLVGRVTKNIGAISVINGFILTAFIFLGFTPLWFNIIAIIIVVIGLMLGFSSQRGDDVIE